MHLRLVTAQCITTGYSRTHFASIQRKALRLVTAERIRPGYGRTHYARDTAEWKYAWYTT